MQKRASGLTSEPETAENGGLMGPLSRIRPALIFLFVIGMLGGITLCLDQLLSRGSTPGFGIVSNKENFDSEDDDRFESESSSHNHAEIFAHELEDLMDDSKNALSIVCQLSGEFGNNIGKFVHAYVLWLKLTRAAATTKQGSNTTEQFTYRIILRHQLHPKWVRGRDDAQLCFPTSLGRFDFTLGNGPDFDVLKAEQTKLQWMELFAGVNLSSEHVQGALENFTRIAAAKRQQDRVNSNHQDRHISEGLTETSISLPFLWSETLVYHPTFVEFVDEYYHEIRGLLRFDEQACCALKPFPDESVFVSKEEGADGLGSVATLTCASHDLSR